MARERTRPVCDALAAALRRHGVLQQILTDNRRVFTGRFGHPPVEVLSGRICRENGIDHLLTAPRSPTTTGKIERFHRALRAEFDTRQVFSSLETAQQALDEWVGYYNAQRPHQALGMATPASRFGSGQLPGTGRAADLAALLPDRSGEEWVAARSAPTAWSACPGSRYPSAAVSCGAMLAVALGLGPAALRGSPRAGNFLNSR